jgi:hypothetical protein
MPGLHGFPQPGSMPGTIFSALLHDYQDGNGLWVVYIFRHTLIVFAPFRAFS